MRKRITGPGLHGNEFSGRGWLKLEDLVDVEVSSEHADHPIEAALLAERIEGWRAATSGEQTIRLLFTRPQSLKRIWLNFVEPVISRTQEYVIRWSSADEPSYREVVRQRWNFNPRGATSEKEDHRVELQGVTVLELCITPDVSGGDAIASLARLRLA